MLQQLPDGRDIERPHASCPGPKRARAPSTFPRRERGQDWYVSVVEKELCGAAAEAFAAVAEKQGNAGKMRSIAAAGHGKGGTWEIAGTLIDLGSRVWHAAARRRRGRQAWQARQGRLHEHQHQSHRSEQPASLVKNRRLKGHEGSRSVSSFFGNVSSHRSEQGSGCCQDISGDRTLVGSENRVHDGGSSSAMVTSQ